MQVSVRLICKDNVGLLLDNAYRPVMSWRFCFVKSFTEQQKKPELTTAMKFTNTTKFKVPILVSTEKDEVMGRKVF